MLPNVFTNNDIFCLNLYVFACVTVGQFINTFFSLSWFFFVRNEWVRSQSYPVLILHLKIDRKKPHLDERIISAVWHFLTLNVRPHEQLGTESNEDGNANNDSSEKLHLWLALYFFVRVIRVLFLCLKLCQ